ncbi:MAG: DUF1592 domain-containing protein [Saprospiraceae bacterium]|nr:DUF1592 domain-containing protein [Saprospiraceae bacterium]
MHKIYRILVGFLLIGTAINVKADTELDRHWRKVSFPIFRKHCTSCHNAADKKGGLDLDVFYYVPSVISRGDMFQHLVEMVENNEMPPAGKPPMSSQEKTDIINLINGILADALSMPDPGPNVVRRLSNREYSYTVKDLVGVDFNALEFFPKDGSGGEGFDNQGRSLYITPLIMERYYMAADSIVRQAQGNPHVWKQLVPKNYSPSVFRRLTNWVQGFWRTEDITWQKPQTRAEEILIPFATKTYRRFLSQEEKAELLDFFSKIYFSELWKENNGFNTAIATSLKRILVSPTFLYRTEINAPIHEPYAISNTELATRLSYFLWSSMPDDSLLKVSYYEDLHDPVVLNRETRRMLHDSKFSRFSESFAPQWLGVEETLIKPLADKKLFPEFTDTVREAMRTELVDYFSYVFSERKDLLELLNSDYSLLNEPLAKFYGISGVEGEEFRPVTVADQGRGGILGMGAVLTATSLPNRTSPVLRGKWVLEQVLGTPAPPPPPDVPQLEEAKDPENDELDLRRVLEKHRESPACAGCHNKMDPLGFVMENFDAVGRWRDAYRGSANIDPTAVMEDGSKVDGPVQLREYLAGEKEKFAKNFSRKLMSYALGRGISFLDTKVINDLSETLLQNDFDSEKLMLAMVNSYPFRYRRSDMTDLYIKK